MTVSENKNPFKAGFGNRPAHLAGRKSEIQVIQSTLDIIKGGKGVLSEAPDPMAVILGPWGVGKTVLLRHSERLAEAQGIQVATVSSELLSGDEDNLINKMFPSNWLSGFLKKIGSLRFFQVGLDLKDTKSKLMSALQKHLSKKPLLIVMDEAHTCEPEALKLLFDSAQECISSDLPLAVIIAGTPGLEPLMLRCNATYVERSKFLRINTLSSEESKEALEIPAKKSGRPMRPDALQLLLDWSDNYPFFIQMAGVYSWLASKNRDGEDINIADAKGAIAKAENDRIAFYERRCDEILRRNLGVFAIQSINIIQEADVGGIEKSMFRKRLMGMNKNMDEQRALETLEKLQEVGFVWVCVNKVEPGIPSLFDYMERIQLTA